MIHKDYRSHFEECAFKQVLMATFLSFEHTHNPRLLTVPVTSLWLSFFFLLYNLYKSVSRWMILFEFLPYAMCITHIVKRSKHMKKITFCFWTAVLEIWLVIWLCINFLLCDLFFLINFFGFLINFFCCCCLDLNALSKPVRPFIYIFCTFQFFVVGWLVSNGSRCF